MNADKAVGATLSPVSPFLCCAGPALLAGIGATALSATTLAGGAAAVAALIALGAVAVHHRNRSASPGAADCCAVESSTGKSLTGKGKTMSDCCAPDAKGSNGRYDLAVIGAGSAGFSAAITAADQGANVALIGHGMIGGTCVNIGCVPSKTLIRAAETLHNARAAARFGGIAAEAEVVAWRATIRQKDALVAGLRQAKYVDLLPAYNGIAYREGPARLVEGGVEAGAERILADKIVIATGARPAIPAIPGVDSLPYLTSTSALDLAELPRSLVVIGGGYVGVELAQMFSRAGVKVTLVCRSRLLPEAEPEIGSALTGYFADEGIEVVSGVAYRLIRKTESGLALAIARDGREMSVEADKVLIATGRAPNIEGLGVKEFGVALSPKRAIVVDDRMRTTRAGVYAAGDVTGRDEFVYMAAYGAKLAAKNALNGDSLRYDNSAMPAIVFTDPQVASVGLTEFERAQGRIRCPRFDDRSRPSSARTRRARHARADQARRGRRKPTVARRAHPGARGRGQHPDGGPRHPLRSRHRRPRGDDLPLPDHCRGLEIGGARLRQERGEALVLRRIEKRDRARFRERIRPRWERPMSL